MEQIILIKEYGISLRIDGDGKASIKSDLHDQLSDSSYQSPETQGKVEAVVFTIESIIKAHAKTGIKVDSTSYLQGLESCIIDLTGYLI